jgi:hypothetical protein
MHFTRGIYEGEERYLIRNIEQIERMYDFLLQLPASDEAHFFSLADHKKVVESGDARTAVFHLLSDAYNWLKLFVYTNSYKVTRITEGLVDAYNRQNYLVWLVLTRSLIEYSAVFYYYHSKTQDLEGVCKLTSTVS